MTACILATSIAIQFVTAVLALRLIAKTRRMQAWVLIATALLLMAFRRGVTLAGHIAAATARPLDPVAEGVALVISLFMLAGVALLGGVFDHVNALRLRAEDDLEKRRQAETQARAGESRLRAVFDAAEGIPIQGYDRDRRVVFWNPASERLYGWTREEAMGRRLEELMVPPHLQARLINDLDEAFRTGRPPPKGEFPLANRSGDPLLVYSSQALVTDADGNPVLFSLDVDLTHRKRAEEERMRMQKLESLGIVAGGIAHDFNNLLTGVFGHIDLALMDLSAEHPAATALRAAQRPIESARRLAGRLLTFAQGGNPVLETLDIREHIREAVAFNLIGSGVAAEFDLPDDLWPVRADRGQFEQVIANLTINARQAMGDDGHLWIEARNQPVPPEESGPELRGAFVRLTLRDDGPGIPPEHLVRIFDPYFTTKEGGSGLGLAVTYSIVTKHGGRVRVESPRGGGAAFTLFLPAENAVPHPAPAPSRPTGATVPTTARILVMDDEAMIRKTLKRLLERGGYAVEMAADGREAVDKYAAARRNGGRFDLVIMDLTIPGGMGGKEAIRALRAMDPGVRAIVSSGYSSDPVMADCGRFGFDGCLAKPFDLRQLQRVVEQTLHAG